MANTGGFISKSSFSTRVRLYISCGIFYVPGIDTRKKGRRLFWCLLRKAKQGKQNCLNFKTTVPTMGLELSTLEVRVQQQIMHSYISTQSSPMSRQASVFAMQGIVLYPHPSRVVMWVAVIGWSHMRVFMAGANRSGFFTSHALMTHV